MTDPAARARSLIEATAEIDLVALVADDGPDNPLRRGLEPIAAPDLEINLIGPDGVRQGQFQGVDGFVAAWRDWTEPFTKFSWHPTGEVLSRGNRAVNFVEQRGTIAGTTNEVLAQSAALWHFSDDGMLQRIDFHLDRDVALRCFEEAE